MRPHVMAVPTKPMQLQNLDLQGPCPVDLQSFDTLPTRTSTLEFEYKNWKEVINMLRWAVIFLVIALVAALFGFTGIAAAAAGIAKFLFFLFLAVCLILFIIGMSVGRRVL